MNISIFIFSSFIFIFFCVLKNAIPASHETLIPVSVIFSDVDSSGSGAVPPVGTPAAGTLGGMGGSVGAGERETEEVLISFRCS